MADSKGSMLYQQETIEAPPPSYSETVDSVSPALAPQQPTSPSSACHPSTFKPIVIPQVSYSIQNGAFISPFSRAYASSLYNPPKAGPISQGQFLRFIDGLNDALIASPALQATSFVGTFLSALPLPIVPLVGTGILAGSGLASSAEGLKRANVYLGVANKEIFLPRGLRCRVMKTGKMMLAVGHSSELLSLPVLENEEDPRMRRLRALGDRVAELQFEFLPAPEEVEGWWKSLGSKEAKKKDLQMHGSLMHERERAFKKMENLRREAEAEAVRYDRELVRLDAERDMARVKAERKLTEASEKDVKEKARIEVDLQSEMRKLDNEVQRLLKEKMRRASERMRAEEIEMHLAGKKEQEVAQKLYWIVIDREERSADEVDGGNDVERLDSK